ncbi:MAG: contractile injection system tape measure protein [Pseudomonadota bacterium]
MDQTTAADDGATALDVEDLSRWFEDPARGAIRVETFVAGADLEALPGLLDALRPEAASRVLPVLRALWSALDLPMPPNQRFWSLAFRAGFGHLTGGGGVTGLADAVLAELAGGEAPAIRIRPVVRERLRTLAEPELRRVAAMLVSGWATARAPRPPDQPEPGMRLLTNRAGLVLLGPYLPMYFERLGLVENGAFRDDASHELGVAALRVLLGEAEWGETPPDALESLICAVPGRRIAPVPAPPEGSADLAESLLTAVIGQWSALGKTSVAGLRAAFLVRTGTIDLDDPDFAILRVDPGPYDMLIDRIPWSIGVLKTRWMERPLHVHWRDEGTAP